MGGGSKFASLGVVERELVGAFSVNLPVAVPPHEALAYVLTILPTGGNCRWNNVNNRSSSFSRNADTHGSTGGLQAILETQIPPDTEGKSMVEAERRSSNARAALGVDTETRVDAAAEIPSGVKREIWLG